MIEFAVVAVAVAVVVLVGYVVPTLIHLRRTVSQSEKLLIQLNAELPSLLQEVKGTTENVHHMTAQAKQGVDRASVLLNAIGEVGKSVNQVHGAVRGRSITVLMNVARFMAGLKAASSAVKQRVQKDKEGGGSHV